MNKWVVAEINPKTMKPNFLESVSYSTQTDAKIQVQKFANDNVNTLKLYAIYKLAVIYTPKMALQETQYE